MGWATNYIEALKAGNEVSFRPRGNSMQPRIASGQLVRVVPVGSLGREVTEGDVVLCTCNGRQWLHLVQAVGQDGRYQIGNNKGHINGWTSLGNIYGVVVEVQP